MKKSKQKSNRIVLLISVVPLLFLVYFWFIKPVEPDEPVKYVKIVKTTEPVKPAEPDLFLELINADNAVSEDEYELAEVYGVVSAATSCIKLNPTALSALQELFNKAKTYGYTEFYLTSGFRSYEEQSELYENAEDKSFVMPAGHSEHQTGLAADISYLGGSMDDFDKSKYGKWFMKNAHKYGFILRYPADKTALTGISYEPWHYRYVGKDHATYMYKNKLCLEEYIKLLGD